MATSDPFTGSLAVPVAGGELHVARAGPPPDEATAVVLAAHGITASHLNWRTVARELDGDLCLLAPDLRGRGASRDVGPPNGISAHVDDLLAVLDHVGVERAVLAGHSMGAYIVARFAAEHPDRAAAIVLVDGGLHVPMPAGADPDAVLDAVLGPAIARLAMTFASPEEYLAFFERHPAFAGGLDGDVEAYVRYDLTGQPGALHSRAVEAAVRADGRDILLDEPTRAAVDHVRAPLTLVRAARGLLGDDNPLIPRAVLEAFVASHPEAIVHDLPNVNHYTVALGTAGAAGQVAAAIAASTRHSRAHFTS